MKRRSLLGMLFVFGAGLSASRDGLASSEPFRLRRLHRRIARLSRYPGNASQIKAKYDARWPHPKPAPMMLRELIAIFGQSSMDLLRLGDNELLAALRKRIAKDFEEARVSTIDGWLLSETELLFSALVASSRGRHQYRMVATNRRMIEPAG